MKSQWVGKNMDLSLLAERVRSFFHGTDFATRVEQVKEGYIVEAVSKIPNLKLNVNVEILGRPNDFTVKFSAGSKGGYFSLSMIIGYLTTMFGGGYLVSTGARKQGTLEMIEKDFWRHTDAQVADLVGSASQLNRKSKTSTL